MRVNSNKIAYANTFQAKPPPIKTKAEIAAQKLSDDWKVFLKSCGKFCDANNPNLVRDLPTERSIGTRTAPEPTLLSGHIRKY